MANLELADDRYQMEKIEVPSRDEDADPILMGLVFQFEDELSSSYALGGRFREMVAGIFGECALTEKFRIAVPDRNSLRCLWEKADASALRAAFDEARHPISPDLHDPDDFEPA
jgi:hypothetical protein